MSEEVMRSLNSLTQRIETDSTEQQKLGGCAAARRVLMESVASTAAKHP